MDNNEVQKNVINHYETKIEKCEAMGEGLMIHNVKIMAEGQWHASNASIPMRYGGTVLRDFATAWEDNSLWSTHDQNRSITKKVGEIINPRFQDNACVADVFLHGFTQESRDSITLITSKAIDSISAEIAVYERNYCPKLEVDNAVRIGFVGAALVSEGACEICKLHSSQKMENDDMSDFEEKLAEIEASVTEITEKFAALVIPEPVDVSPVTEELAASKETIVTLNASIEALEARMEKMETETVEITHNAAPDSKEIYNPFK